MTAPKLEQWLHQNCPSFDSLQAIPGDASFRRYFRLKQGEQSYIVMDASDQMDAIEPFVAIDRALLNWGVCVPEIKALDEKQGYMLISDFGDKLYLNELKTENADQLYQTALTSLSRIQACPPVKDFELPHFNQAFMQRELDEFKLWFLQGYLKLAEAPANEKILQNAFQLLIQAAEQQPQVFIHRDYHSANLMFLPEQPLQVGILDFQDACRGPVTYDLVSLLRDCYISWPDERVNAWVAYYYQLLRDQQQLSTVELSEFTRWFDWMGMQRHMKALFIFARKYLRDNTTRYLQHIPRTLDYVVKISERYPEFQSLHCYAKELMLPALSMAEEEVAACAR